MKIRYIRISTANQKISRQLKEQYKDEKLFIDICSGSIPFSKREQGKQILNLLDEVTYLSVEAIDRLGRNIIDILTTLEVFENAGITVKVENLGIESLINGKSNSAFKMIVSVLANVSEMERKNMLERQKQGIAIAKAKGTYKGRIRGSKESDKDFLSKYKNVVKHLNNKQSLRNTAKLCDVSLGTVQKVKALVS
ncbi:recombinase family protein [Aquimarina agarilytica]|uniref:recombinase family protein n=1 Tax=Aquimarina agarilytica TaxID=1087449 RepID=UPI000288C911|nr:recombinase family protein [Aquimarina agarilytica]